MANDTIQVNYETLARIKQDFTRSAEESARMHQRLKTGMDRLVGGRWEGEAARQFFNEMENDILPAFDRLSKALYGCQDVTTALAQQFRQAEEEAAALFKKDGDGSTSGSGGAVGAAIGSAVGAAIGSSMGGLGSVVGGAIGSSIGQSAWGSVSQSDYNWAGWAKTAFGKTTSVITTALKTFGTFGEAGEGLLSGIGLGVNIAVDEDFPSNISRAIAGEAGKFAFDTGVKAITVGGLVALAGVPAATAAVGVGIGFLILKGVPLGLHLAAGSAELSGNAQLASILDDWSKKTDYGRPVEKAAETVYDAVTNGLSQAGSWLQHQAQDFNNSITQNLQNGQLVQNAAAGF